MTAVKERVRVHREKLRAAGLRPVTTWLPDTRSPAFAAAAARQSQLAAEADKNDDTQDFFESLAADVWDEA